MRCAGWKFALFLFLCLPAAAGAQIRILMPEIEGLILPAGDGPYQKILKAAAVRAGITFQAEAMPKARALEAFLNGAGDGIFTYTQTAREHFGADKIIAGYPFGAYRGYVFTALGTPAVSDLKTIKGWNVGGIRGFEGTYSTVNQAGAVIDLVTTDDQNLKKLASGRIRAFLGFLPDLAAQAALLSYDPARPFFEAYDRLTMHNTAANRAFLTKLSAALEAMHRDGTIAEIVGGGYLAVEGRFNLDN